MSQTCRFKQGRRAGSRAVFALAAVLMLSIVTLSAAVPSIEANPYLDSPDYGYILSYNVGNINIDGVQIVDGSGDAVDVYEGTNTGDISSVWDFDADTGIGPFNSFYAAINLDAGDCDPVYTDLRRASPEKGNVGFILDPYDLKRTIDGDEFTYSAYNIVLVIPTIYWNSVANEDGSGKLYVSNRADYSGFPESVRPGMAAYAHTVNYPGVGTVTMPYLAIGVYQTSYGAEKMLSQSGKAPMVNEFAVGQTALANLNVGMETGRWMAWDFHQWTLSKIMSYTVMGNKHMSEVGFDATSTNAHSGYTDATGPYSLYSSGGVRQEKMFIEAGAGGLWDYIGGAFKNEAGQLLVTNDVDATMGEILTRSILSTPLSYPENRNTNGYRFDRTHTESDVWDMPVNEDIENGSTSKVNKFWANNPLVASMWVGDRYGRSININDITLQLNKMNDGPSYRTYRLAYVFSVCNVSYDAGGGTGDVPVDNGFHVTGSEIILGDKGDLAKDSYEFVGWSDGRDIYQPGDAYAIGKSDVMFTAVWKHVEEEEEEDEREEEEDDDDIFRLLDANRTAPRTGGDRSMLWFAVVAAAVSLAVSAAMVISFRNRRATKSDDRLSDYDDQDFGDRGARAHRGFHGFHKAGGPHRPRR